MSIPVNQHNIIAFYDYRHPLRKAIDHLILWLDDYPSRLVYKPPLVFYLNTCQSFRKTFGIFKLRIDYLFASLINEPTS